MHSCQCQDNTVDCLDQNSHPTELHVPSTTYMYHAPFDQGLRPEEKINNKKISIMTPYIIIISLMQTLKQKVEDLRKTAESFVISAIYIHVINKIFMAAWRYKISLLMFNLTSHLSNVLLIRPNR